ncbi:MAG: nitroreductase family protein [Chitinivibrionales bacterium]|nr:nitroreductase family protein [Chitinivibrionales bacterium]
MPTTNTANRQLQHDVDCIFPDRWSPRAFSDEAVTEHQLWMLFEAARWAPSCNNEQPWEFIYANDPVGRDILLSALHEKNRLWAQSAPIVLFAVCRKTFRKSNQPNRHAGFDTGAAWMSLTLQARRLGLYAHAMAGFSVEKAHEILRLSPQDYDIMAAIVIGRHGNSQKLPEELAAREQPTPRKEITEVGHKYTITPDPKTRLTSHTIPDSRD